MPAAFTSGPDYATAFTRAEEYLKKGRNPNDRPVENNTRMRRIDDDTIAIVLHRTAVVTLHRDTTFTIYGGGWNSNVTLDRIRHYSPASPYRHKGMDSGTWTVGDTGERTAPRVQKCRSCKGRGRWMEPTRCWGAPGWGSEHDIATGRWCRGAVTDHAIPYTFATGDRRVVPCEHAMMRPHPLVGCEHGELTLHMHGEHEETCSRCQGEGIVDYGSNMVPITVGTDTAYTVDVSGTFIDTLDDTPSIGTGWKLKPTGWYHPAPAPPVPVSNPSPHEHGSEVADRIEQVMPGLNRAVKHPLTGNLKSVRYIIVDLNDDYRWSRERIADWLDTLDVDLRFPAA